MITDQTIIVGTDVEWSESFADYPATSFDLAVTMKHGTDSAKTLTIAKDGDTFDLSIPNTLLTVYGDYQFQYKFTNLSTSKVSIPYSGVVSVLPNLSTSGDTRSEDQKVYEELIDARLRVAKREYVNITINGKATQFKTLDQIDKEIVRFQKRLGIYSTPKVVVRFV